MKVSAKNNDRCDVLLNGHTVSDCLEADDREGWVKVYKRNPEGDLYSENGIDVATEVLKGTAVIERWST